jgi:phosphate transport system substrate-binding protein
MKVRRITQRAARGAAALAAAAVLAACGNSAASSDKGASPAGAPAHTPPGTIVETGSTLLYPLMSKWAAAYQQQHAGIKVTSAATGSGAGLAAATAGTADIGASDAYLASGDLVKNPALLNIPLAVAAQQVNYNLPEIPLGTHVRLNGTVLAGMFDGTITRWNDPAIQRLNPGLALPDLTVVPVHRSDSSGDTFLFTSYLSTQDQTQRWSNDIGYGTTVSWPAAPGAVAGAHTAGELSACKAHPGCVAYNGISYLNQARGDGLGDAMLANAVGNYTLPTPDAINASVQAFVSITPPNETISLINGPAAAGYPIVNYEYAVVSTRQPDPAKARELRDFLTWVISSGNSATFLAPVGFQPLQPTVAALDRQQICQIGGAC